MRRSRNVPAGYTIRSVESKEELLELVPFFREVVNDVSKRHGGNFNFKNFRFERGHRLTVCRKNGVPVGLMLARLFGSIFDPETKVLYQDVLYCKSGTRAAKLLMDDFIDFGKANANHVITCIAETSNVKRRSLERLGFKELEILYRMEIVK